MNRLARLAGFALALLMLFLGALAITHRWLREHTERAKQETIAAKQAQFDEAVAFGKIGPPPWSEETLRSLGLVLGATVANTPTAELDSSALAARRKAAARWEFTRAFPAGVNAASPATITVRFTPPVVVRLATLFQESAALLLALALGLLLVLIVSVALALRARSLEETSRTVDFSPTAARAKAEINSLAHLAQVSVRQNTELERERGERMRAEEDALFQQTLLNRALEEKIRLGHDLHDGIIQSLYAAGLTVEAAKNLLERDPAEAFRQLDAGVKTINATIREVRGYIAGLSPESLHQQSFADALRSLTQTLDAGREVEFDLRIDDEAAAQLGDEQTTQLLQIAREAVSNGLRHGGASQITVRLHCSGPELCLLVQDNGRGFTPTTTGNGGHGLANMRARASRLGGMVQLSSAPGSGARLIVTLPVSTPKPAAS
jgi:signal transduction histidine kinase